MRAQSVVGSMLFVPVALFVKLSRPRARHLLLSVLVSAEVFAGVEVAEEVHRYDLCNIRQQQ